MNDFELARDNLHILSVSAAEVQAKIANDIVPESVSADDMETQIRHQLKSVRSVELSDDGQQLWGYYFSYVCGLRYIVKDNAEPTGEPKIFFTLEAEFVAKYHSSIELHDKTLEAFGKRNVCYHVWPYWRELAHSTLARFELPRVSVPHYFALQEPTQ